MKKQPISELGAFIRHQREQSAFSLGKLAERAGISNPYLSQIERGLRKPSAEIMKAIAMGLSVPAEVLYHPAGLLERKGNLPDGITAIAADPSLNESHKRALTEIYASFVGGKEST